MVGLDKRSVNMESREGRASQNYQEYCILNEGQR